MIKTDYKFEYTSDIELERYPVIIVAAGSSSRMQGLNKQFLEIGEVPVIARTMSAFENSPLISDPASFVIGLLIGIAATALCFTIGTIIVKSCKKNNKK